MFTELRKYLNVEGMSLEKKIYDTIHIICFISVLAISALVHYFFESRTVVYITFGMAFMFLLTMFEANRTGRFSSCAIIMSIIFNVSFLPLVYLSYGKFVCVIPIYFLFGIAYTALTVDRKKAVFLGLFEIIVYLILIYFYGTSNPFDYSGISKGEINNVYSAATAGVVLVSLYTGFAVRFRHTMYKNEESRARSMNKHAHEEYAANDIFLTNMSHEIRTPMNAIVGNVNLMLDETDDGRRRYNIYNILNSCDAFISVVDELMNLSKSENRDIVIEKNRFDFHNLIMEIVNMVSVRMLDRTSEFAVDIRRLVPRYITGDASKIRQILVNAINSAEKKSKDAWITLAIDFENGPKENALLKFEAHTYAYSESNQQEAERNDDEQTIMICSEIAEKMGGRLELNIDESHMCYDITLPVEMCDESDYINKEITDRIDVIFLEKDFKHREALSKTLAIMNVKSYDCRGVNDLEYILSVRKFSHLLIAAELYEECRDIIDKLVGDIKIIMITNLDGNIEADKIYASILRPLHIINLHSVFTGEDFYSVYRSNNKGDFVLNNTNILVVDDNYTNLNVAGALLKKYGANVLTASSGGDALRILKDNKVQLIFMDYMMPEMDGIETLARIRNAEEKNGEYTPSVALSANVVSGAREMFINSGFDEFIPKPIDVGKMERCLREFLPEECLIYK